MRKIEEIELGIENFHLRQPGVSELTLVVSNPVNPIDEQKMILAKFDGCVAEDRQDLTYAIRMENCVEQANCRIEMAASGVVQGEFSFQVENN